MKFIDLFSGIGGFRTGLEMHGHECVAFCEIDKFARQSYKAIYDTEGEKELHDITQVTDEQWRKYRGSVDIITGGFPCQAFSIAGNRRGFEDTRGTLFFEIARAIKEIQPSYALLENVKGLFSHDKGRTFGTIIQALDELGYVVEWGLFNSKFWGVPQNRERVFILVTRKDVFKGSKLFDLLKQQTEVTTRLVDVLEDEVDEKFYLSEEKTSKLVSQLDENTKIKNGNVIQAVGDRGAHSYSIKDIAFTVPANAMSDRGQHVVDRQPKIAIKGFKEIVKVRKYDVNKLELTELLRNGKQNTGITNKEISNKLDVPITKVEHWFRRDNSFSIPDAKIWFELKTILNITNTEHDEAITTFEEKESEFDTTNRIYDVEHLSPTLNTTSEPKVAVPGNTSNTGHRSHDIHDIEGISSTITARDYKGAKQIAVPVLTPDSQDRQGEIINPLKGKTSNGWHFEQQVYDPNGISRAVKAGGGSGNIPKTILPKDRHRVMVKQVEEITNKTRPNEEIGITIKENGDIRPHRMDKRKSGISELNINHENNASHTITTSHSPKIYGDSTNLRIRKLTPLECWRLQGFTDEQFYKAKNAGVSNSQLYKQAGNSVTVNVIEAIAKTL